MPTELISITPEEPKNPEDEKRFKLTFARVPGPWGRPHIEIFDEVRTQSQLQEQVRHQNELQKLLPLKDKIKYTCIGALPLTVILGLATGAYMGLPGGLLGAFGGAAIGGVGTYLVITAGEGASK